MWGSVEIEYKEGIKYKTSDALSRIETTSDFLLATNEYIWYFDSKKKETQRRWLTETSFWIIISPGFQAIYKIV